jgi:hypothetical protein
LRLRRPKRTNEYERVRAEAVEQGRTLCAYMDDEQVPHYFTMPPDATETEVRDEAFRRRNGRDVSPLERSLLEIAETMKVRA